MASSDRGGFESSILAEIPVLYRVARRMVASPEEAEDLVQSTILSALKGRKSFDGRFLRSWLVKILRNETLAYQKKKRIHVSFEELPDDVMTAYPFWSTLSAQLDANAIQDEIAKLPEPYRLAIHLCDIEHMSYEEAADIMEVPLGTVRSRLFRARVEIRRRLGESDEV